MSDNDKKKEEKAQKQKKEERKQPQPPKIGRIYEKPTEPDLPDND